MNNELDFLVNLSKEAKEGKNESKDRLSPSEKLLVAYDDLFNETNRVYNDKDREIMTKTRLVRMNKDANRNKRVLIQALTNTFFALVLIFIVVWLNLSGFVSLTATIVVALVIVVFFTVDFFRKVWNTVESIVKIKSEETGKELAQMFEKAYADVAGIQDYTCQEYCPPSETEEETVYSGGPVVPRTRPRYIRQDSQRDVWLKGDLPSSTYTIRDKGIEYKLDGATVTGFNYDKDLYISPQGIKIYRGNKAQLESNKPQTRRILPIDTKYATYYNCEFRGGKDSKDELPYKKYYEYTTIPCDNYPGFVEKDRFICPNDPKKNGVENCKRIKKN